MHFRDFKIVLIDFVIVRTASWALVRVAVLCLLEIRCFPLRELTHYADSSLLSEDELNAQQLHFQFMLELFYRLFSTVFHF